MEKIQSVCMQAVKDVEPAKEPVNFKAQNDNKESDDKGMRKNTKIMLGATALAAVVATTVAVVARARKGKMPNVDGKPVETIKEYTLEAFRQNGRFNKGRAILNDGTNYTGTIKNTLKDGSAVLCDYENGFIKKATKVQNGETLYTKNYAFDENGFIKSVKTQRGDVENVAIYSHYENGKLKSFSSDYTKQTHKFIYDEAGRLKYHYINSNNEVFPGIYSAVVKYYDGTNVPQYVLDVDGGKRVLFVMDKDGKELRHINMNYSNQRLFSKNYKNFDDKGVVFSVVEPNGKNFSCSKNAESGSCAVGDFTYYGNKFQYTNQDGTEISIDKTIHDFFDKETSEYIKTSSGIRLEGTFTSDMGAITMKTNNNSSKNIIHLFDNNNQELGTYNILTKDFVPAENSSLTRETVEKLVTKYENCISDMKQMYRQDVRANIDIYKDMYNTLEKLN